MGIGPLELAIVAVILLIIFGPKRLPAVGRSIGEGVKGFRETIRGTKSDIGADEIRAELESSSEAARETRSDERGG